MPTNKKIEMNWESSGEHLYPKRVSQFLSSKVTKIVSLHRLSMQKGQMVLYLNSIKLLKINVKNYFVKIFSRLALVLQYKYQNRIRV